MNASTEQTEAQDGWTVEKEIAALKNEGMDSTVEVIESLRAQLEAARSKAKGWEEDARGMKVRWDLACNDIGERDKIIASLRADLAQKMQEHQDALSEMRGRIAELEEAAVDIAHGMHQEPQYILMRGLNLIDGNRIEYKLRNGKVIDAALSPPSAGAV